MTAVVLAGLVVAVLLALLLVAGLARAAGREMPTPPRSDRDA